jgi:hypothetical protein
LNNAQRTADPRLLPTSTNRSSKNSTVLLTPKIRPYLLQHAGNLATSDIRWMAAQRPDNGFVWATLWGVRRERLIYMSASNSANMRFHCAPRAGAAYFYAFITCARCEAACMSTSRGPAMRLTRIWYHGGKIDHKDILRGPGPFLCVIWKDSRKKGKVLSGGPFFRGWRVH